MLFGFSPLVNRKIASHRSSSSVITLPPCDVLEEKYRIGWIG
jgi:hypothetical protein